MPGFNLTGELVLRLAKVGVKDRSDLEHALSFLIPIIADEILKSVESSPAAKSVALPAEKGWQGTSGEATVSSGLKSGSVSVSLSSNPAGGAIGTITGIWNF